MEAVGMEKQSFLVYLGVGFLMTLGVWGLMGGCSSDETKVAKVEESISSEDLSIPTVQPQKLKPEETVLKPIPVQEKIVAQEEVKVVQQPVIEEPVVEKKIEKVIQTKKVVKRVKKTKIIEEEKIITHVVAKGDTLWGISRQYKTVIEDLMELNDLSEMNVRIGQKLKVKAKVKTKKDYYVKQVVEEPVEVLREVPVVRINPPEPQKKTVTRKASLEKRKPEAPLVVKTSKQKVVEVKESKEAKEVSIPVKEPLLPEPKALAKTEIPVTQPKEVQKIEPKQKGPTIETFTGELLTHEVASEDSLITIASKYETSVPFLQNINGLTDKSQLQEGQILLVPGK